MDLLVNHFPSQYTTPFTSLIIGYPTVFKPHLSSYFVKHDVIIHHICTYGSPVNAQPQKLAPEKLLAAHQESEHMLEQAIICPSSSH